MRGDVVGVDPQPVLDQLAAGRIPVVEAGCEGLFSYPVMQRFGIPERRLPAGSTLVGKPPGLYDQYRGVVWAMLFGTCLAPISGRFGPHWGLLAGFLHVSVGQVTGAFTVGLNLYGNGFAAGLVAAVVSPVALMLHRCRRRDRDGPQELVEIPAA